MIIRRSKWFLVLLYQTLMISTGFAQTYNPFAPAPQAEEDTLAWKRYPIEVFCSKPSVKQGDPISFYVASGDSMLQGATYTMKIYRVGANDSLVFDAGSNFTLVYQPLHDSNGVALPSANYLGKPKPREFKTGCAQWWNIAYTATGASTNGWKSGFYYVKCSLTSNPTVFRRAPFVIKENDPGSTSNILYKIPINTYQAYNSWGGSSLYSTDNPTLVQNNDSVSFLRPMGASSGFTERTDIGSFDRAESSLVRWAERSGYTMEYCTNIDLDDDPDHFFISKYKFIVTSGHDEYWTDLERQNIENYFINVKGSNTAFLSGNICYWRATYNPDRTKIVVGKNTGTNQRWRYLSPPQPEAKFIGIQFGDNYGFMRQGGVDTVRLPSHWIFRGTNLVSGSVYGYGPPGYYTGAMGGELDRTYPGQGPPYNVEIISSAFITDPQGDQGLHEASFYINTNSNARVFGAGSIYWSWGLNSNVSSDKIVFTKIMTNLMDHFSEKKFLGNIYSPVDFPLRWNHNVEIDSNAYILSGKGLSLANKMNLTLGLGDTLFVDGTLEFIGDIYVKGSGVIKFNPSSTMKVLPTIPAGWSMVSVPVGVADFRKSAIYPFPSSPAFGYHAGYVIKDTLTEGMGYWVRFDNAPSVTYSGIPASSLTINVDSNWNMIGSISVPLPTRKITMSSPDSITSFFFGYNNGNYYPTDTLYPGKAYWVQVSDAGQLVLNSNSTANVTPPSSSPNPPPAPELNPPNAPTLNCSNCQTALAHPSFTWNSVSGAASYKLYRYGCPFVGGDCELEGSQIYSGTNLSFTDNAITVFQKTGENPIPSNTYYYYVMAVDSFAQYSPQSNKKTVNTGGGGGDPTKNMYANVEEEIIQTLPMETKLIGCYPNPFNPSTTISYQIAEPARVSLSVYNVLGQEITRLVDQTENVGYYNVVWDGSNNPSGVYYLRVLIINESKKEIYLKVTKLLLTK